MQRLLCTYHTPLASQQYSVCTSRYTKGKELHVDEHSEEPSQRYIYYTNSMLQCHVHNHNCFISDTGTQTTAAKNNRKTEDPVFPLQSSQFLLVLQTAFQQQLLQKYGNLVTMMDGIYRTTKYGFPCFFVTVKTSLGIGRVVATIITQDETEALLTEGLKILKQWNPQWSPTYFMTDKSSVELGAVANTFPNCIRLLCDFHRVRPGKGG